MWDKDDTQTQENSPKEPNESSTIIIPDIDTSTYQERGLNTDEIEKKQGLTGQ